MKSLSIFGTSSDAGKSTISFVIGKLLKDLGYTVAPFKAQNVSNNSRVTDDGRELAIAQHFQASVLGVEPVSEMNPVLLKSGSGNSASLILNGKPVGEKDVLDYYRDLDTLKPIVKEAFTKLKNKFDIVVCEGAGSPVELNLMDKDLSNIYTATFTGNKIILVADIERGGSFASIWGTINLLPKDLRDNVIGVIINKFRGDASLYDEGIRIIEEDFGVPVLGVLPYKVFNLGFEDSQSLFNYRQRTLGKIRVAILKLPHISNFNDFEPLVIDDELSVEFVESGFDSYDLLIIPGSKRTIYDLNWIKENGLDKKIIDFKGTIFGVCGGFQMMFNSISDPIGIEDSKGKKVNGFSFIDDEIEFKEEKILTNGKKNEFGLDLEGFEIHHGVPSSSLSFYKSEKVSGTFLHGIFENDNFREMFFSSINSEYRPYSFLEKRAEIIDGFVCEMKKHINIEKIRAALLED